MDLSKIATFTFMERFSRISSQLADPQQLKELLDEARRDTPIIDGLLGMLEMATEMLDGPSEQIAFQKVMRDIHVILTLRSLDLSEATEQETQLSKSDGPSADKIPFRFRRAADN